MSEHNMEQRDQEGDREVTTGEDDNAEASQESGGSEEPED